LYLDPSPENVAALIERAIDGPIVMLNLLRLRAIADYAEFPELAPAVPISGREAYDRYIEHTRPYLEATGGSVLIVASGGMFRRPSTTRLVKWSSPRNWFMRQ